MIHWLAKASARSSVRSAVPLIAAAVACFVAVFAGGIALSQVSISSDFDHFTTGFRLDGQHQFADCASCHIDGLFVGTPMRCVGCHSQASRVRATAKPARHSLTTEQCEACHRTTAWVPVVHFDHFEALAPCFACHDNRRARGKPTNHIPAPNTCDDCHNTRMFAQ